jgi:hypothetical protein
VSNKERGFYNTRISQLEERLAVVMQQLDTALGAEEEFSLNNRAEQISRQIDEFYAKLDKLDLAHSSQDNSSTEIVETPAPESYPISQIAKENTLTQYFQKIDFSEARKTASVVKDILHRDGGFALFFLQKSKRQMGKYCLHEIHDEIMRDRMMADGSFAGSHNRFLIDLNSPVSYDHEIEILTGIGSHFGVDKLSNIDELSQRIIEKIYASLQCKSYIFLEVRGADEFFDKQETLGWFIEYFWQPLIDKSRAVVEKNKSRFVVFLVAGSKLYSDPPVDYFCDVQKFDCCKILELSLPNWTAMDIYDWLIDFRSFSPNLEKKTEQEIDRLAARIYRDSEGTPESICISLRELFL